MSTARIFPPGRRRKRPRILVVGLGNILLGDDGVGVQAVRELRKSPPAGVLVAEVGTAVLDALHLLAWADRILAIDALQAGGSAGTIYTTRAHDIEERGLRLSLHELSLLAALRFLPQPPISEIAVLGIEPETIELGLDLSPTLRAALPQLVQSARDIIARWRSAPLSPS